MLEIDWDKVDGLVPAIIQDQESLQVLMLGYMNQEALNLTKEIGFVTFYSRSKKRLWTKGETSGNKLKVLKIYHDCDRDALLITAHNEGPTCHLGNDSCFGDLPQSNDALLQLAQTIDKKYQGNDPKSYTYQLHKKGIKEIAKKVTEEAGEVSISAVTKDGRTAEEAADLIYHLMVLLKELNLSFSDVTDVLKSRSKS
mgnify:CR=1 FL=1